MLVLNKYLKIRVSEEELKRIARLAGESTVSEYVLGRVFSDVSRETNKEEYPGWEVVELKRRDGGIKIRHEKYDEAVVLYPEDSAYKNFI